VRQQVDRFLVGFDDVFEHEKLRLFSVPEVSCIV